MPIVVTKGKSGSKEDVIGTFRRLMMEENIVDELRERTAHKKPSEKRYAKLKVAIWRKKCRRRAKKSRIVHAR